MKEEHDLAVQKKAICITEKLLSSISSINMNNTTMPNSEMEVDSELENYLDNININENKEEIEEGPEIKKSRQIDSATRVLDILSVTKDCELLSSLKTANVSNIYPNDVTEKSSAYISINDFLLFTSTYNFNECNAKTKWVISTRSGLDSMLNDIIGYSTNCFVEGADLLDCY